MLLQDLKAQAMEHLKYRSLTHPVDVLVLCYELGLQTLKKKLLVQAANCECPDLVALHRVVHLVAKFECPDILHLAKVR